MDEIDQLRGRVGWLDRWRHIISMIVAGFAGAAILSAFNDGFEVEWSPLSVIVMFTLIGATIWWVAECTIAGAMAIWDTRAYRLSREHSMPIARLLRRRRK